MQEFYQEKALAASVPFRTQFNDDSFELFQIHYPEFFEISNTGYRTIYKNKQKTQKSLFNKLGTNYKAYPILINLTIEEMIAKGEIKNETELNPFTMEGYTKIINYLKANKAFFASILPPVGDKITTTSKVGDEAELGADEVLRKIFGQNVQIRKTAGLAAYDDTHSGKDRIVIKDGNSYNVQIKICSSIEEENGTYYIGYIGAKLYPNIDIMIFKRGNWYFVFRSKDARGISTLQILGDREGYMIPSHQKVLATKLEPRKNV